MPEYDASAFRAVDWDARAVPVEGEIAEVPDDPYAKEAFITLYFDRDTEIDGVTEEMQVYMEAMENDPEDVLSVLRAEDGRRTVAALLSERGAPISRRYLTRLAGTNPDDRHLDRLEDMGMLQVSREDGRTMYQLKEDSDAYWLLQVERAADHAIEGESVLSYLVGQQPGMMETDFVRRIRTLKKRDERKDEGMHGTNTAAMTIDEYLSQW